MSLENIRKQLRENSEQFEIFKRRALDAEQKLIGLDLESPQKIQKLQCDLNDKNVHIGKLRHDCMKYPFFFVKLSFVFLYVFSFFNF